MFELLNPDKLPIVTPRNMTLSNITDFTDDDEVQKTIKALKKGNHVDMMGL